ncbi:MAG: apolipoprotein N-acyltransferase, partial [Rhodobacteraceae bacterium]|nr:apolipoprotein N-acyltransferase [Paracoccaceae bacterium]
APPPQDLTGRPIVRLVQPNAPQSEKWDPDRIVEFYRRQLDFTAAPADPAPDLVVWPESAIAWPLDVAEPIMGEIAAAANGTPVVLGLNRREDGRWFNSLVVVDDAGNVSQLYDKHHLVPFGEYIPFGHLTRLMGLRSFAARDGYGYSPGPGPRLLDLPGIGPTLPLICYEAIFPQGIRAAPARPDLLLQITNDAWFGEISGPYQHLAQARVRAVEQGLPLVRVANTGVSAVIDPAGRILAEIPLGQAGFLDQAIPAPVAPTLYASMGDLPILGLIVATLAGAFLRRRVSH